MRAYVGTRSLLSLESLSTNVTFYHYSSINKAEYDFIPKFLSFPKLKTTYKIHGALENQNGSNQLYELF